jgi:large exoprotein involved in heme utilization and adhesion
MRGSEITSDTVGSDTVGSGKAGTVAVTAHELELHDGSEIHSTSWGLGDAGQVTVKADHLLVADGFIASPAYPGSTGRAGNVTVTAHELELHDGAEIFSTTWGPGDAGQVIVTADRLLVAGSNAGGYYSKITSQANPGSTGQGGNVTVTARDLELHDGAEITSSTFGFGNAGQVTVTADHLLGSSFGLISSQANSGSTGQAGNVTVTARELELHDGTQILSSTWGPGDAGQVMVKADHLLARGFDTTGFYSSTISSAAYPGSTGQGGNVTVTVRDLELHDGAEITSSTWGAGDAGQVTVKADHLLVVGTNSIYTSTISSSANFGSTGAGGAVTVQAQSMELRDRGVVTTESDGTGPGGPISITAVNTLRLDNAAIQAQTALAKGGDVTLAVGRLFDLHNSTVTTSVAGGTGNGGNIFINPYLMVLDNSRIEANAQRGAGGNITIQAGQLIRSPDSVIRASSELGLSGTISIAAPNTDVAGSLVVLPGTFFDASSQLRETCAARGGRPASSFTAGGRGGLPPDPGAPLAASPFGQPLEQQTAIRSSTTLTAKSQQAVNPITIAGIPQPVLGSPRLTCRG